MVKNADFNDIKSKSRSCNSNLMQTSCYFLNLKLIGIRGKICPTKSGVEIKASPGV